MILAKPIPPSDKEAQVLHTAFINLATFIEDSEAELVKKIHASMEEAQKMDDSSLVNNLKANEQSLSEYSEILKKTNEEMKSLDKFFQQFLSSKHEDEKTKFIDQLEDKLKYEHSSNAVFFFFVFGVILQVINRHEFSLLKAVIFFAGGMIIAALSSMPSYYLKSFISKRITFKQLMLLKKFYWLFEMAYTFIFTYIVYKLIY